MMDDTPRVYATAEAATKLGISPAHLRRLAAARAIGQRLGPRTLIFTDADLARLRRRKTTPGRARRPRPIE